jgi:ERF superfamily
MATKTVTKKDEQEAPEEPVSAAEFLEKIETAMTTGQNVQYPMIYCGMSNILKGMDAIVKKKQSKDVNYAFRSIDDVMNALHPLLAENSVFVVPMVESFESRVFEQDKRDYKTNEVIGKRNMFQSLVQCRYRFYAIDGSYVDSVVASESSDYSDKATQQALSYCFKIALLQSFCIPTKEVVTDGDERTPEASGVKVQPQTTSAQPTQTATTVQASPALEPVEMMPPEAWQTLRDTLAQFGLDDNKFNNWSIANLRALSLPVPPEMKNLPKVHGRVLYPIAKKSQEQGKLLLTCYKCRGTQEFPKGKPCDKCDDASGYTEMN